LTVVTHACLGGTIGSVIMRAT